MAEVQVKTKTKLVNIPNVEVNVETWARFIALPSESQRRYVSDVLNDAFTEILDKNDSLLGYYIKIASGRE